jgi:hypothetical protein
LISYYKGNILSDLRQQKTAAENYFSGGEVKKGVTPSERRGSCGVSTRKIPNSESLAAQK